MAKPLVYNATLVERIDFSPVLATFRIALDEPAPPPSEPWFIPGQYMTLGMNNEAQPDKGSVRRPMSIASAPSQRDVLDFYIRYVKTPESDNPLTHLLWTLDKDGRLYVRNRAVGKFTLDDTVDKGAEDPRLKILVAAGTGLAPFTSMVFHYAQSRESLEDFAILHAASYPPEIGYKAELEALVESHGLHYRPSVSRPKEAPDWKGDAGRVEDFFLPERLEQTEADLGLEPGALRPDNAVIYICGLTGTIQKTIERLLPRGFIPDHKKTRRALEVPEDKPSSVFFEQYDSTPIFDVKDPAVVEELKARFAQSR